MSTTPKGGAADVPVDVNDRTVRPWWHARMEWVNKLDRKLAHKALDIPDDEMNVDNSRTGLSASGAIGVAMAAGLPGLVATGLLGYFLTREPAKLPPPVPPAPVDRVEKFDVLHYDSEGNLIRVPHISERPVE